MARRDLRGRERIRPRLPGVVCLGGAGILAPFSQPVKQTPLVLRRGDDRPPLQHADVSKACRLGGKRRHPVPPGLGERRQITVEHDLLQCVSDEDAEQDRWLPLKAFAIDVDRPFSLLGRG